MSCPFCAYGVQQKLQRLEGAEDLKVELSTGLATLTLEEGVDISNELLQETVKDAGFEVAKIVRTFESGWEPSHLGFVRVRQSSTRKKNAKRGTSESPFSLP